MKTTTSIFILSLALLIQGQVSAMTLEQNTDRPGMFHKKYILNIPDVNICANMCKSDNACKAFTFVKPGYQTSNAVCHLKNGVPNKVIDKCCISGVKGVLKMELDPVKNPLFPGTVPEQPLSKEGICKKHADTAILAYKENINRACGYLGEGWGNDYQNHYLWCMSGDNYKQSSILIGKLRNSLEKCRTCETFSKTAVNQNALNISQSCGLYGPEWNSDYNYHFKWCMHGQNHQLAVKENTSRKAILDKCKPLYGNFKVLSVKPFIDNNSLLQKIEIGIATDSTKPWAIGRYGPGAEGSLWLKLRIHNKTGYGPKIIDRIFSLTGKTTDQKYVTTFMTPHIGMSFPAGYQEFPIHISSGYPSKIRLEAFKMLYHHPGGFLSNEGIAQPGSFKCSFNYPDVEVTVYMVTNAGLKSATYKLEQFQNPNIYFNTKMKKIGAWSEVPQRGSGPCP